MSFKDQKSSKDAYSELISQDSKGCLVDVRSNREWCISGVVDLSLANNRMVLCEWRSYPSMNINENPKKLMFVSPAWPGFIGTVFFFDPARPVLARYIPALA